jgi:hypothetical protein
MFAGRRAQLVAKVVDLLERYLLNPRRFDTTEVLVSTLLSIRVIRVRLASGAGRSSPCDLLREKKNHGEKQSPHCYIDFAVRRCENLEVNRVTQLRDQDH